ncbi:MULTISPECIES: class I SAM-dependent methyltransferase [Myroides]|uniref:Methyltransferase domain-containing protein n=1 Tax=Myroides albus TaxID=2562892 RepID=A0A6I3LNM5_9FLAO|nr:MULTISPECIES: class I SAM-dependent methyltransferase [Myroides]MTG99357.1 methyltransferase domain-containing protein [Myroides albus]MVX34343.1 methyltransferase domain-containing protein [Myroides sp. LoEW2-1]UVD80537.1 class I SAM-dependent methyltransferase [Myroides albus]
MEQKDYSELANQLSCPHGEDGVMIGNRMFVSNSNMIFKTIDRLNIKTNDSVLELGFGSGRHLPYMFEQGANIRYVGIEVSKVMIDLATDLNLKLIKEQKIEFLLGDGSANFKVEDDSFTHCLVVNTIYFWEDPVKYLQEIFRILKTNGTVAFTYIREDFAHTLPFVIDSIFHLHRTERLMRLMTNIGYRDVEQIQYLENTIDKIGNKVTRPFVILKGIK